jgi:hypothetical protein
MYKRSRVFFCLVFFLFTTGVFSSYQQEIPLDQVKMLRCQRIFDEISEPNFFNVGETHFFFFNVGGSPHNIGLCCIARKGNDLYIFDAGRKNANFHKVFQFEQDEDETDGIPNEMFNAMSADEDEDGMEHQKTTLEVLQKIMDGSTLKLIVISHPHTDHYNFIPFILNNAPANVVQGEIPVIVGGDAVGVNKVRTYLTAHNEKGFVFNFRTATPALSTTPLFPVPNQVANFAGVIFYYLGPTAPNQVNPNDSSLICNFDGMVFTGDATQATLTAYGNALNGIQPRGFVFPHHGANTHGSENVVDRIVPQTYWGVVAGIIPAGATGATHPTGYVNGVIQRWSAAVGVQHSLNVNGPLPPTHTAVFESDYPDDSPLKWIKIDPHNVSYYAVDEAVQ